LSKTHLFQLLEKVEQNPFISTLKKVEQNPFISTLKKVDFLSKLNIYMSGCYVSYKKKNLNEEATWLLKQECCDHISCSDLARDLEKLQYECNDLFEEANLADRDAKGNIPETICAALKDKKISTLNKLKQFESRGGKKSKSKSKSKKQNKRQKSKSRKIKRNYF